MKRPARIQIDTAGYRLFVGNVEIGRADIADPQYVARERIATDLVRDLGGQIFRAGRLVVEGPRVPAQGMMFDGFGQQVQGGLF